MENKEILEKAQKGKDVVGEMERTKVDKGGWIALVVAGVLAVAFIIAEGALGHFAGLFAIAAICYTWASVQYFCQYFLAKRPWPVLFGAILHGIAAVAMLVLYVLVNVGVLY